MPAAIAGAVTAAGAVAALRPAPPLPTAPATGAMYPGGILPPPPVACDARSPGSAFATDCGPPASASQQLRKYPQHDWAGAALLAALPPDHDVVDVFYGVYPQGLEPNPGRAYVFGRPPTPDKDVRLVVWLMPPRTRFDADSPPSTREMLRHVATLTEYEMYVASGNAELTQRLQESLSNADRE